MLVKNIPPEQVQTCPVSSLNLNLKEKEFRSYPSELDILVCQKVTKGGITSCFYPRVYAWAGPIIP